MGDKVIRWKQRFSNLESAFTLLSEAVSSKDTLSLLEKEGLVKRFEITFELAWKTLKDYRCDVVDYKSISNPDLKKHIDEFGKTLHLNQ